MTYAKNGDIVRQRVADPIFFLCVVNSLGTTQND